MKELPISHLTDYSWCNLTLLFQLLTIPITEAGEIRSF